MYVTLMGELNYESNYLDSLFSPSGCTSAGR
jgi:hypothetical protein